MLDFERRVSIFNCVGCLNTRAAGSFYFPLSGAPPVEAPRPSFLCKCACVTSCLFVVNVAVWGRCVCV